MPMGAIDEDRTDRFLPLTQVFDELSRRFALPRDAHSTGGPARYWRVAPWGTRLGLTSPLTSNSCDSSTRVRLPPESMIYLYRAPVQPTPLTSYLRHSGLPPRHTAPAAAR